MIIKKYNNKNQKIEVKILDYTKTDVLKYQ